MYSKRAVLSTAKSSQFGGGGKPICELGTLITDNNTPASCRCRGDKRAKASRVLSSGPHTRDNTMNCVASTRGGSGLWGPRIL